MSEYDTVSLLESPYIIVSSKKDPDSAFIVFKRNGRDVEEWWDLKKIKKEQIHPIDDKWVIFGNMLINVETKLILKSPIVWIKETKMVCNNDASLIWICENQKSYFVKRIGDNYKTINCNINYIPLDDSSWPKNFKWDKCNQIRFSYITNITKQNKCMRCNSTHIKWKKGTEAYAGHVFFEYNTKMNKMIPISCILAVDCKCTFLSGKMKSTKLEFP